MILIDGSSLLHRVLNTDQANLSDSRGRPTGGIHGFLVSLGGLINRTRRSEMVVCTWDLGVPLFRREIYRQYKSKKVPVGNAHEIYLSDQNLLKRQHEDAPDTFLEKYQLSRRFLHSQILPLLGVLSIHVTNCEADDIIAYICNRIQDEPIQISSNDRDMVQLLTDNRVYTYYDPNKRQYIDWRIPDVIALHNLVPEKWREHWVLARAIAGDTSDEVPGVGGVGFETAIKYAAQVVAQDGLTLTQALRGLVRIPGGRNAAYENLKGSSDVLKRNMKLMDLHYALLRELPLVSEIRAQVCACHMYEANPDKADALLHDMELVKAKSYATSIYQSCAKYRALDYIQRLS